MNGRLVIFDMDGTMADTSTGIVECYRLTARAIGLPVPPDDVLKGAMSGSLRENIQRIFGLDAVGTADAMGVYRNFYLSRGESMIRPFDGILECLRGLHDAGYCLAVATMRLERLAEEMLVRWGVRDLFGPVRGADAEDMKPKAQMIASCLSETGITPDRAIMIGDSPDDLGSASACGVPFIAAAYGYSLPEGLCRGWKLDYVKDPKEIFGAVERAFGP